MKEAFSLEIVVSENAVSGSLKWPLKTHLSVFKT